MKMYVKIHEAKFGLIVAVADEDLLGKKFKFGSAKFFVNPRFYEGELADKEAVIKQLQRAASVNLVGPEAVSCGKIAGIISDENILMVNKKVPHAQAVVIPER